MKLIDRINNLVLFILALYIPFYTLPYNKILYLLMDFRYLYFILPFFYIVSNIIRNKTITFTKPGNLTINFLLLFFSVVISGIFAYDSDLAYKKVISEFQFLIVFLVINNMIINQASYEAIFKGLLVSFLLSVIIALGQYMGLKQFYLFTNAELNGNAGLIKEHHQNILRIWGPYGNSLGFSQYLSIVGVALYSYYRNIKRKPLFAAVLIIVAFFCIVTTVGRTALFATTFAITCVEFVYLRRKSSKIAIFSFVVVLLFLGLALILIPGVQDNGNPLINRFSNASQDLKEGRLNLWVKGYEAFSKNIFFGVGPGNLHLALSAEGFPMTSEVIAMFDSQHVENYYLTILYTYGIFGFFFFVKICYYLLRYSYNLFLLLKGKVRSMAYGGAMMGAVICFLIINITTPALVSEQRTKMLYIFLVVIINNSFLAFDEVNFFKKSLLIRQLLTKR